MENWSNNQYHNLKVTQILSKLIKMQKYIDNIASTGIIIPDLTKVKIQELIKGKTECLICSEKISSEDAIWHCSTCWRIHHLSCIIKWIIKTNEHIRRDIALLTWKCPHCNTNYVEDDITNLKQNCYCTQNSYLSETIRIDPSFTIPHGCEALCSKALCKHIKECPLICHPGPHVECKTVEEKTCACGQTTRLVPCSELNSEYYCEAICNKVLPCQIHKCKSTCHKGPCTSLFLNLTCDECLNDAKEELNDFIKQKETIEGIDLNIDLSFILTECIFNSQLPCNRHLSVVKNDQAQFHLKRLIKNNSINLKQLISIFVPLCKVEVVNSCNCKKKSKFTPCYLLNYSEGLLNLLAIAKESKISQCNNICSSLLQCRNHRCGRKCCHLNKVYITNYSVQDPHGYHLCHLRCGKTLDCRRHNCEETCHPGKCPPCSLTIAKGYLICNCGKTRVNAPYPCNCKVKCEMTCNKKLYCAHYCESKCHEGICPPCIKTLSNHCLCGKNEIEVLCSNSEEALKCKSKCDQMLNCNVHLCSLTCHIHDDKFNQNCKCQLKCQRSLVTCVHLCQMNCHGQSPCDETICKIQVVIQCKCGLTRKGIACFQVKQGVVDIPCGNDCSQINMLTKVKHSFEGIDQLTREKILLLYPNINLHSQEIPKEELPSKYHPSLINYAKNKIHLIIKLEEIINQLSLESSSSAKFQSKAISLRKKDIDPIIDWLVIYHRLKIQKNASSIIITDISCYAKQRHRLSLIALIFKNSLFDHLNHSMKKCCKVYHPFYYAIGIVSNKHFSAIEELINKSGVANRNDYYLQETKEGEYSIHLFSALIGRKLFDLLKAKSFEFPQCYCHEYYHDEDDESHLEDYLTNQFYFNYLNIGYDDNYYQEYFKKKEEEKNSVDEEGFITIKKKRKAK